jgi:CRP-like cAMP-binding protein
MRTSYQNELLDALPADEARRLASQLVLVLLHQDALLCGEGRPVGHVYFPTTSLVSVLCSTSAGDSMDVAVIGTDGVVGLTFSASSHWTPGRAVVQRSGEAWRLPLSALHQEFAHCATLQLLALRYQQLLMAQMAQTALCSRLHRVDQQLCRWILLNVDRCGGDRLEATQQQVARMLGVRREAISAAAGRLEAEGALHWGRGHLCVLDRAALDAHCCECHRALRGEAQALFPFMRRVA